MKRVKIFDECVHELSRLPGIGRKTASRLTLYLLKARSEQVYKLSDTIKTLKDKIKFCRLCGSISEDDVCPVCADERRKRDVICVVEEAKDVFFIENTGRFNGLYHVLGGKISPLDGIGPSDLRFSELIERVKDLDIKEVIIATNPDVDGETTASYIGRILGGINDLKITKLASGIPIGSHLEYADEITVLRALDNSVYL